MAVIGFTLTFGAAVFGLLRIGVGAVDQGQYEAAYALGYSSRRTFYRIILPQALPHVLPAFKGEIVGLIKATAIVGYIAVQDLTKMGDIVRSRTYEAFFPLIAVTIIYFMLEELFRIIVSRISISLDPKQRKSAEWTFRYAAPKLTMEKLGDDLVLSVLKGMADSMDYAYEKDEELPNLLTLKLSRH